MRAAVNARGDAPLKLLGVTVLTSLDDADLVAAGYRSSVGNLVEERARQAAEAGMDGLVSSPREAALVREAAGSGPCHRDTGHPAFRFDGGRSEAHHHAR